MLNEILKNQSMKIIFTILSFCFFQFFTCQRLNDDIKFDDLDQIDSIKIENIKNLLSKSKIITKEECNRYALRQFGCIKEYTIVYLYENEPILVDAKNFNIINEMRSDSTEKTVTYISKTRTFITDWKNKKFISKQIIKDNKEVTINNPNFFSFIEIEGILNSK